MPKKKTRVPKDGPVWRRTPEQATLDRMPKYNAHACGTGAHGDAKYNRAKQKRSWRRELDREARNRGSLSLWRGTWVDLPLNLRSGGAKASSASWLAAVRLGLAFSAAPDKVRLDELEES